MARHHETNQADETLHQIEESFDRVAHWVSARRIPLALAALLVLAVAAGSDLYQERRSAGDDEAAEALAHVRADYLNAMGAEPGALVFAEPANPEIARSARERFVKQFEAVGHDHAGSSAAALALLEAGNLHEKLGAPHLAVDAWKAALESAGAGTDLEALLLQRMARAQEDAGDWKAAAEAHERAGRNPEYPGRWHALADAARCRLEAGEPDAALALFTEIQNADVLDRVPASTVARLRELEVSRQRDATG